MSLRLELIKLVYRHDLMPEALIGRARALEVYVNEPDAPRKGKGGWPKGKPRRTSESPADTQEQTER